MYDGLAIMKLLKRFLEGGSYYSFSIECPKDSQM